MNILSKITKLFLLCVTLALTSQAYAGTLYLSSMDWAIDPDGASGSDTMVDIDKLTYDGFTLVQLDTSTMTFTNYNYLYSTDTGSLSSIYGLSALTGSIDTTTGSISFDTGSELNIYTDSTTDSILTLSLVSAKSNSTVDTASQTIELNQMIYTYVVTDVAQGYFFIKIGGEWVDLYYILNLTAGYEQYYNIYDSLTYVYAATTSTIPDGVTSEAQSALGTAFGVDLSAALVDAEDEFNTVVDYSSGAFVTTNSGSLDIQAVPEPGMLSLMGLAFLGLAGFQSRRKRQQNS